MATEQSKFSRLPKKQLLFISEKLIDDDFSLGNPYEGNFNKLYKTLQEVSRYFSIESTYEDVEFFAKFLEINKNLISELFANNGEQMKNKKLIDQLKIPVAKSYDLNYSVWGSCSFTYFYVARFDSYDKEWVKRAADEQRDDGNWNLYDGRERGKSEYDNHEENGHSYDDIYEVKDKKTIKVYRKESMLDKLVIENTKNVVNSLDKKTLSELRRIIDSKLRLL